MLQVDCTSRHMLLCFAKALCKGVCVVKNTVAFTVVGRMSSAQYRHIVWESPELVAYLHPRPWTPGSVILAQRAPGRPGVGIFQLEEPEYLSMLLGARDVGALLCDRLRVRRCALVTRPQADIPAQV